MAYSCAPPCDQGVAGSGGPGREQPRLSRTARLQHPHLSHLGGHAPLTSASLSHVRVSTSSSNAHPFRRSDYGSYALPKTRRMVVNVMDRSLRAGAKKRVVAVIVCEDTTSNRVPAVTFDGCPGGVTLNHGHCLCSPFLTDTATLGSWV